jgi:hypothetical protein
MTFNFNIFQCFSNISNHLSNFSYLVSISCKIFIRWRFYLFLKTENSRRVAESRPVCVGLNRKLFVWYPWALGLVRSRTFLTCFAILYNTHARIFLRKESAHRESLYHTLITEVTNIKDKNFIGRMKLLLVKLYTNLITSLSEFCLFY